MKFPQHFIVASLLMMIVSLMLTQGQTKKSRTGKKKTKPVVTKSETAAAAKPSAATTTPSGLIYLITRSGNGRQPQPGETVVVHYTGLLTSGVKFDSSLDSGTPYQFKLGAGKVIKGWDEGIGKLHIGDQAILVIPPQLGYGARGVGGGVIPPDATLIFIVELVDAKAASN
jgi:FKBP-type peptidyl-prolyl cis-trans isomerase